MIAFESIGVKAILPSEKSPEKAHTIHLVRQTNSSITHEKLTEIAQFTRKYSTGVLVETAQPKIPGGDLLTDEESWFVIPPITINVWLGPFRTL